MSSDQPSELTSWKEIADRLQVTVRTAQEWEKKRGLPVRRVPGGGRSRVFIRVDELEAWLDGQLEDPPAGHAGTPWAGAASNPLATRRGLVALLAVVGLVVIAAAFFRRGRPVVPVDYQILPSELVIFDEQRQELWRARFEDGLREATYANQERNVAFDDLDGDGALETLFILRPKDKTRSHSLICFDNNGEELWRFDADAHIESGKEVFENIYSIGEVRPFDLADGTRVILATANHHAMYPARALVLGADGSTISEYWHSGHIGTEPKQVTIADMNIDGSPEIYLAGISNAYKRATLVVLDPLTMGGAASEADNDYQLQGFAPGREIARILFRRSEMNRLEEHNIATSVWTTPEFVTISVTETIDGDAGAGVMYYLAPDLTFGQLSLNSAFPVVHRRLREAGQIDIDLEEQERLLSGVDYVTAPSTLAHALRRPHASVTGDASAAPASSDSPAAGARPRRRNPAHARFTRHEIIVSDEDDEELWRAELPVEIDAQPDAAYARDRVRFVDLNDDGRMETLLALWPADFARPGPLICFDADGREMWRHQADVAVATAKEDFENIYHVEWFAPLRMSDGRMGVVAVSVHYLLYPTQIALLSASDGGVLAEYWHAGHIGNRPERLTVGDRDNDGRSELYALGVSNARNRATLVVLDPETMAGASTEQNPDYQLLGLGSPREIARVLFPRSAISRHSADDFNFGEHVWLTPDFINVQVRESLNDPAKPSLVYPMRSDLTAARVVPTTPFEGAYELLLRQGVVSRSLAEEIASLEPLVLVGRPRSLAPGR